MARNRTRCVMRLAALAAVSFAAAGTVGAGSIFHDFESGPPAGTVLAGNAAITSNGGFGDSGVLRLTDAVNSQNGEFFISDITGGAPITQFTAGFHVRMGDSTCCDGGMRPADGFSFSFGSDLSPGDLLAGQGEEGAGNGVIVSFDAWDNGPGTGDTAPAVDLKVNGAIVATQSMDGIREGSRPPETPLMSTPFRNYGKLAGLKMRLLRLGFLHSGQSPVLLPFSSSMLNPLSAKPVDAIGQCVAPCTDRSPS